MGGCLHRDRDAQSTPLPNRNVSLFQTVRTDHLAEYLHQFAKSDFVMYALRQEIKQVFVDQENQEEALLVLQESKSYALAQRYELVRLQGEKEPIYLELHKLIQQEWCGENRVLGAFCQKACCFVVVKKTSGLEALSQVQELQTLEGFDELESVLAERFRSKFEICGLMQMGAAEVGSGGRLTAIFRRFYTSRTEAPRVEALEGGQEGFYFVRERRMHVIR